MFKLNKRITIIATLIMILLLFAGCYSSDITGKWIYNGQMIEFLSDGTIYYDECSDMYPPTYEMTDEGYLKVGIYDYGWVTYEYTYFTVDSDGNKLTLTDKANSDRVYVLERSGDEEHVVESNDVIEYINEDNNIINNVIRTDEEKACAAIEKYFVACNNMDLEAMHNAAYPKGYEMNPEMVCESDYEFFVCWTEFICFPLNTFVNYDFYKFDPEFCIYDDYPLLYEGEHGKLINGEGDIISLEEALPNFSISYEILEMKPFEDCDVYGRQGLDTYEIDSMDKIVPDNESFSEYEFIDVDNMYVAKICVEYYYNNNLYGNNKEWWSNEKFLASSIDDTYEEEIEECAWQQTILFIYEYEENWYVYSVRPMRTTCNYEVEF